jgi:glycosyltransferase involved in cell wall biosynthesis
LHVISGDLWAGAEAQAFTQLAALHEARVTVAAALMNEGELASRLRSRGVPVTVLDENRLPAARILLALRRLMLDWQPDIVHTHRSKENILGSLANRLAGNVPSVRTVHGAGEDRSRGLRRLARQLQLQVDHWCGRNLQNRVIAVSAELGDRLARDFTQQRVAVIENGIDVSAIRAKVHPVDFRTEASQATHIGIVGRLVPVKRVDLFLESAAQLQKAHPERNWRWHVIGEGPLREALTTLARNLTIESTTTFHGHRDDIVACLAGLDALVICSDHEGLPMVLLEALAVGTPVVAHATGGMVEVLKGMERGLLVEQHDSAAYAQAINTIVAARSTVRSGLAIPERFTAAYNCQSLLELYRELLQQQPPREFHG